MGCNASQEVNRKHHVFGVRVADFKIKPCNGDDSIQVHDNNNVPVNNNTESQLPMQVSATKLRHTDGTEDRGNCPANGDILSCTLGKEQGEFEAHTNECQNYYNIDVNTVESTFTEVREIVQYLPHQLPPIPKTLLQPEEFLPKGNDFNETEVNGESVCTSNADVVEAATKIQALYRGHKVRKSTMKKSEVKSACSSNANTSNSSKSNEKKMVASEVEPTKAELEAEFDPNDKELCDAALKIQSAFRGHLTRKIASKSPHEDVDIQEITKKVAEELDIDLNDPELNKAATKIQASFRGHKTRKDATTTAQ